MGNPGFERLLMSEGRSGRLEKPGKLFQCLSSGSVLDMVWVVHGRFLAVSGIRASENETGQDQKRINFLLSIPCQVVIFETVVGMSK